ncbi:DUF2815 family protein [Brevibacillus halotolerans]|nr:DUF2815 family protein [Brevibacillus halotolerans]
MNNQDPQRVITDKVRLSFVHLFTPRANPHSPNSEPKYSCTVLIPKSDFATKQRIDSAINAAIQEAVGSKWSGVRPPFIPLPIHDGDGVRPSDGMPFGEECRGHWVLTASSKADRKPDVVDINLNPIINQSEIYSGVYARVSLRFFGYVNAGKKGIGCGLGNVQKLEDGQPLSGSVSAASDFGTPAGYTPAPQQSFQQAPSFPQQGYMPPMQNPQVTAQQQQMYPPQQGYTQQPYGGASAQPPQQQGYAQQPFGGASTPTQAPQQQMQVDPITGAPLGGGIMGL